MDTPTTTRPTTGRDLELERTKLGVQVQELAGAMGAPSSTVSRIENSIRVTPAAEKRYRDALATFATVPTPDVA